jgi:hypothetical protein
MRAITSLIPLVAGVILGAMGARIENPPSQALMIPQEIIALAQDTRLGGEFMLEVDASGKVISYAAQIDPAAVPAVCRDAIEKAHPGGKVQFAEKEIIDGKTYFELSKEIDGLRVEALATPEGAVIGGERVLPQKEIPADVVAAANKLVPEGEVIAVERIHGPESLGAPEHHVKKQISGEVVRIRVTDKGAVEVLRKLKTDLKVPRKK